MRARVLLACLWAGLLLPPCVQSVSAQEAKQQRETETEPPNQMMWKIVNTAIFVIGLGYLIGRSAPAFFNARSADIQKAIKDATGLKIEADFRYSEIDRKMATLAEEVNRMRAQSTEEMEREHERMRQETALEMQRLEQHVAAELEAFRKEGIRKVRQQTVQAALGAARQKLRERLAGGESDDHVRDFVHLVEQGRN